MADYRPLNGFLCIINYFIFTWFQISPLFYVRLVFGNFVLTDEKSKGKLMIYLWKIENHVGGAAGNM